MARVSKPYIITRDEWGARNPGQCSGYRSNLKDVYNKITVHHTAGAYNAKWTEGEAAAEVRNVQQHHFGQGWCDIGYHYLIGPDGSIFSGRSLFSIGAHTYGHNEGNLGICLLGNFEHSTPTPQALKSLADLCAWFCQELDIHPSRIKGHRDYDATACPGKNLYYKLENIRKEVESKF